MQGVESKPPKYVVDDNALRAACEFMGLKRKVRILNRAMFYTSGRYHGLRYDRKRGFHHLITVMTPTLMTPQLELNKVIWHELTHAKQLEKLGTQRKYFDEYDRQLDEMNLPVNTITYGRSIPRGYREIPMEKEAYGNERMARKMPYILVPETSRRSLTDQYATLPKINYN